jgi:hypothetical protein
VAGERSPLSATGFPCSNGRRRSVPGAALRLTRMDIQPSGVADAVEAYGDTAVPGLAETEGSAVRCCWSTGTRGI